MSESRVARWRERLRQEGKKPVTIWLSTAEELRLKDVAATWHTSPSAIMQQALAQFHPGRPPRIGSDTEMTHDQRRDLPDTAQIQAWLQAELPGMVRQCIEQLTLDTLLSGPRYRDKARDISDDIQTPGGNAADTVRRHTSAVPASSPIRHSIASDDTPQRHSDESETGTAATYDTTRYSLGKLCRKGHN